MPSIIFAKGFVAMKRNIYMVIFSLCLIACTTPKNVKKEPQMANNISHINFLKAQTPSNNEVRSYHLALTHGYLVLKNNCLFLAPKLDSKSNLKVLIWPWDYSLKKTKGSIHILNGEKNIVAKVGQHIKLGGSGGKYPAKSTCYQDYAQTSWVVSPIK